MSIISNKKAELPYIKLNEAPFCCH